MPWTPYIRDRRVDGDIPGFLPVAGIQKHCGWVQAAPAGPATRGLASADETRGVTADELVRPRYLLYLTMIPDRRSVALLNSFNRRLSVIATGIRSENWVSGLRGPPTWLSGLGLQIVV